MNIRKACKRLKVMYNNEYFSLEYKVINYADSGVRQVCTVYVNNYGFCEAQTWRRALDKMKDKIYPKKTIDKIESIKEIENES